MSLDEYGRKRDFRRTREPRPRRARAAGRTFVVQKHQARQLHYDVRLEHDGVLLSWAVPRGPSLDPTQKRLAVRVEDHPTDYADFEGVIPEGEYGGGAVMIWDRGQWEPLIDPATGLDDGQLKFNLFGRKLGGRWALVRMAAAKPEGSWLLIKERDDFATTESSHGLTDEEPYSIVTGRTLAEIAEDQDYVWTDAGPRGTKPAPMTGRRRGSFPRRPLDAESIAAARRSRPPAMRQLPQPVEVNDVPDGNEWLHEIAYPGRRVVVRLDDRAVVIESPPGHDVTHTVPRIARSTASLPVESALIDAMLVKQDGTSLTWDDGPLPADRERLQLLCLDLPWCAGYRLTAAPLQQRLGLLGRILDGAEPPLLFGNPIRGKGETVTAHARSIGAPGILSRRADSPYRARCGRDWQSTWWCQTDGTDGQGRLAARPSVPNGDAPRRAGKQATAMTADAPRLTHPERILYPEQGVTKRMLADYFAAIAPRMLPHLVDRPLSLYRCPQGIEQPGFFQKRLAGMPDDRLDQVLVERRRGDEEAYIFLRDAAGLAVLAQWNVIELHPWGCRTDNVERPDRLIFDLDPGPDVSWEHLAEGARGIRYLLEELDLASFLKASGGKGLHVVVPIARRHAWDDLRAFAAAVAGRIAAAAPRHFTTSMNKHQRKGRVFLDVYRNTRGATAVAPYSPRARPGALVAAPLPWSALDGDKPRVELASLLEGVPDDDPWEMFFDCRQSITKAARRRLEKM